MYKEDLMKIEGMTGELAEKVAAASKEEMKDFVPKARFDEVNEAKKNAESLVKERDRQLEDLKKSNNSEDLTQQIEKLQAENKASKTEYEAKIRQLQIDNALNVALTGAGAKNNQAVKALLKDLDKAEIDENGTIKGLSKQLEALKESDSYLFHGNGEAKPLSGVTPAASPEKKPVEVTKEQFSRMGYSARMELFNNNRELYDSLTRD